MKLNNRGWGLGVFLLFLLMFFIMLLIVARIGSELGERFNNKNNIILLQNI